MSEKQCYYKRDHGIVEECDACGWTIEHDEVKNSKDEKVRTGLEEMIVAMNVWTLENCHKDNK